jgi:hypothetical protein
VVDWDGLENRSRCKPTVGSNPTPSAAENRVSARVDRASPKIRGRAQHARRRPDPTKAHDVQNAAHTHLQSLLTLMAGRLNDRYNLNPVTSYIAMLYSVRPHNQHRAIHCGISLCIRELRQDDRIIVITDRRCDF